MNRKEYTAVRFGFILVITWLILLTSYLIYATIDTGKVNKVIILPPPVESLEDIDDLV